MVAQEQEPTGLPVQTLQWMGRQLTRLPEGFTPHPAIAKLMGARRGMVESPTARVDMGMAEALAFGCLLCHKMPGELGAGHERDAATGHAADMAEVVEDAGAQEAVRGLNMVRPPATASRGRPSLGVESPSRPLPLYIVQVVVGAPWQSGPSPGCSAAYSNHHVIRRSVTPSLLST